MHFIHVGEGRTADDLRWIEGPEPVTGDDDILVRVTAAGVNRADIMQRQGSYPPPVGASPILGMEVSGTVESSGKNVAGWTKGDSVCALLTGGGYAEYCTAPASLCLPTPSTVTLTEAASIPETFFTAWDALFRRARLAAGETCLIQGGSGGVGTSAIQLATAFGATVYTTAGSDEKCEACVNLGARAAINYRTGDFEQQIRTWTENRGVDVIVDVVGGEYFERNLGLLAPEGRLVQLATPKGANVALSLPLLMSRRLTIYGAVLRSRTVSEKAKIAADLKDQVWPLFAAGKIRPVIAAEVPISEASRAHRLMESSSYFGKILLTV